VNQVPSGFVPAPSRGTFTEVNGPFFWNPSLDPPEFGILGEARHCNALGILHGGLIAGFLDSAMAECIHQRHGGRLATLSLNLTYRRPALAGRWLQAGVTLGAPEDGAVRASATLRWRQTVCSEADGSFRLLGRS